MKWEYVEAIMTKSALLRKKILSVIPKVQSMGLLLWDQDIKGMNYKSPANCDQDTIIINHHGLS
jgi:hypothetical protein